MESFQAKTQLGKPDKKKSSITWEISARAKTKIWSENTQEMVFVYVLHLHNERSRTQLSRAEYFERLHVTVNVVWMLFLFLSDEGQTLETEGN